MIRKVENNKLRSEWMAILECTTIRYITWIYYQCHAGVKGNEEADKLVGQALINGVLCVDRDDILKCIVDKFKETENE
jgi:ribonuclease HI